MPPRDEVDVANVLLTKARGDEAGLRALREHLEFRTRSLDSTRSKQWRSRSRRYSGTWDSVR